MTYLAIYGVFALWVLYDGYSRKMAASAIVWGFGTAILGPIVLPVYLAKRPLKTGEVREGGTAWNVLKNFAILWTIVMAVAAISAVVAMGELTSRLRSGAELAGAGIGMIFGMGLYAAAWFFPTFGAALLAFLLKKNSIVENGPTGPLVGHQSATSLATGWVGLLGVAIVALIVLVALSRKHDDWTNRPGISPSSTAATAPESLAKSATPASVPVGGKWQAREIVDEMDGTKKSAIALYAENEIRGYIGSHTPILLITCVEGKTKVGVSVETQVESNWEYGTSKVRIKLDDSAATAQFWNATKSGDALLAPNAVAFSKKLAQSKTFLFEFSPFQSAAAVARFDVRGLDKHLGKVAEACGWKFEEGKE